MTLASRITLARLFLVPVFAVFAVYYGASVAAGAPDERLRLAALATFIIAAVSDGLDGFIARRFHQRSQFGAVIDPLADKALLLTGIITLTLVDWGPDGWRIPPWFTAVVIVRDIEILGGILILHFVNQKVRISPTWVGKTCTVAQMIALGWVMLRVVPFSPIYPAAIATVFTVWSGIDYFRKGLRQLQGTEHTKPGTHP